MYNVNDDFANTHMCTKAMWQIAASVARTPAGYKAVCAQGHDTKAWLLMWHQRLPLMQLI